MKDKCSHNSDSINNDDDDNVAMIVGVFLSVFSEALTDFESMSLHRACHDISTV